MHDLQTLGLTGQKKLLKLLNAFVNFNKSPYWGFLTSHQTNVDISKKKPQAEMLLMNFYSLYCGCFIFSLFFLRSVVVRTVILWSMNLKADEITSWNKIYYEIGLWFHILVFTFQYFFYLFSLFLYVIYSYTITMCCITLSTERFYSSNYNVFYSPKILFNLFYWHACNRKIFLQHSNKGMSKALATEHAIVDNGYQYITIWFPYILLVKYWLWWLNIFCN